ncbi:glutamate 5-kinase [Neomegalonema perideroedes]|uniref:glutamate 5-kinase n=1 Tax=Neomegalonema perideroedes TaxID=217219 RepID=UPI00036F4CCF|nr:glutamate 5-kinase [Neomegalonema perideroedes]
MVAQLSQAEAPQALQDEAEAGFDPGGFFRSGKLIVVKIGSALLVDKSGALRQDWLKGLAADVAALRAGGAQVALVSSGSIALGRGILGLPKGPLPLERAQAAAAVGQIGLARAYSEALAPYGIVAAQVLLTLGDTHDRRRYLNGRSTLKTLLGLGAVPIINENDTVATDEIRYGDNDRLAAQAALTLEADRLILLSDVDGLYTANPNLDPTAKRLPVIREITPEIAAMAGDPVSGVSKGGMKTKVMAAQTALQGGCAMAILKGDVERPLQALAENRAPCSWFLPGHTPQSARKRWISGLKTEGAFVVDAGAARALKRGGSLLPAGLKAVIGDFERGAPVAIQDEAGAQIGVGFAAYDSVEARKAAGRRSHELESILGHPGRTEISHRDDMAIWSES